MELSPHIVVSSQNVPPDIKEKFYKWYDEVYASLYLKIPGVNALDRYEIIKKNIEYPENIAIYHHENRNTLVEFARNETRLDLAKDMQTTFYRVERSWFDAYVLVRSFSSTLPATESTIVNDAPVIHIEGYNVDSSEQGKYDQWFMRWASRVFIPILMKSPGLTFYNCLKLSDLSVKWPNIKYLEAEIPPYISILYFENFRDFQSYSESLEYIAFKRVMEIEFPSTLSNIWNVEYKLVKSWRK